MKTARGALLLPGGLALLAGLDAALLLLGLPAPVTTARLPQVHGVLLVLGFVGTVIALERAVALRRAWAYGSPAALGVGGLVLLSDLPLGVGGGLLVLGCAWLLAVYAALWQRQESEALALQVLGAVLATGSALLWWGGAPVPAVLPWFMGFLVLTIGGERLELARVGGLAAGTERLVLGLGTAVLAAVVGTSLWPAVAHPLLGLSLLALVGVLVVHDVARRMLRSRGLPRYMAWCLLGGYAWLGVAGGVWALRGAVVQGPAYDAVVHAVFLGFTISMIMAHAPVILPAVLGRALPYRPVFYVPVALLHASLALRVLVGDLNEQTWALQTGGVLNIVAVLTFVVLAAVSAATAATAGRPGPGGRGAPRSTPTPRATAAPPVAAEVS